MSFLGNRLKLEVKSTNNSKLASFTSTTKNTNLYIIPEDSSNNYTVLSSSTETSNIEVSVSLHNNNINHKIVSFQENNINFGTDILLKGNLVVLGSITSLGYDVLTEDNKFILNNYGASAEKGLNSASEKTLIQLKDIITTSSNNIVNKINSNFDNLDVALGINNLSTLLNNTFTSDDFNRNLAEKTLDNILQGTSNKFIVNGEYNSVDIFDVSGDIISSNLLANSVYTYGDLYAPMLYGDGSHITNIDNSFMNTNNIIEGSNKYFSIEKVGAIVFSSNISMSNYVSIIEKSFNDIINLQEISGGNYNQLASNVITDITENYKNISNYIVNINDNIESDLYVITSSNQELFLNNSNIVSELIKIYDDNIKSDLSNNSNIITERLNNDINNILNNVAYTSNNIFSNMNDYYLRSALFIIDASNILNNYLNVNENNSSNYILETQDILLDKLIISNMNIYNIKNNMSILFNNILDGKVINISDFISTSSNNIIYNSLNSNNYFNDKNAVISSEYLEHSALCNISLSNIVLKDNDNVLIELSSKFNNINQHILNTSNYYYDVINDIFSVEETSNQGGSNYIYIISQNLMSNIDNILSSNTLDTQHILNNTNDTLNNIVNTLTTSSISQGSNLYYHDDLYTSSLLTKSLDNIQNGTSNRYIIDNTYDDDLIIKGDISAINTIVYGDMSSFNTNTYNTERVEIRNMSNNTAMKLIHEGNTDIMGLSNNTIGVFVITGDGNVGIKKNPIEKLDINGVFNADVLRGSGKYLTSINLFNKTTSDILDNLNSNLYFTDERASIIINSSNADTSNYISTVSQALNATIMKNDSDTSNYILNISSIIQNDENNSNYILNTSNTISLLISSEKIANSNYIGLNSNILGSNAFGAYKSTSNYTQGLQNISYDNIGLSNYILSSYGSNVEIISNINYSHSNYVVNISNIFFGILNTYSIKHSNLVENLLNSYSYDCNYIISSSNITNNYIDGVNVSQSNIINNLNVDITNYVNVKLGNIISSSNIRTVRWVENDLYSCNYYSDIGSRSISYYDINSNVSVGIGKSTEPDSTLDIYTENPALYSIKTNNPIWVKSDLVISSDIRIKKNIRDIDDDDALNQIMLIEPKTYNYIDINRGSDEVIGFIAQQIHDVIPRAITMNKEVIPNIYCYGNLLNNCIYLLDYNGNIVLNSVILIEYNGVKYTESVIEILENSVFKITNKSNLNDVKIFVYGSYVSDFHALDKNYIYTLSVSATQDIDRRQKKLMDDINNISINSNYSNETGIINENIENIDLEIKSLIKIFNNINGFNSITSSELNKINNIYNRYDDIGIILNSSNIITNIIMNVSNIQYNNDIIINKNNLIISNNSTLINDVSVLETNIENIYKVLANNGIS